MVCAFFIATIAAFTPGDRRRSKFQLKVATFNAEFLFLGTETHTLVCPGVDCSWTTAAQAQSHVKQIILHLNEVEDCTVVEAVITQLETLGGSTYRPFLVRGSDTSTGQNAALLTRVDPVADLKRSTSMASIPVSGSTCPSASGYSSTKGVSTHFFTTFNVSGFSKSITLVGAHLLAYPENKAHCFEREAQATVLAGLANAAVSQDNHVVATGDLNDWYSTVLDKNSNKPISAVLNILTGKTFAQVASQVSQSDRYSQWYDEDNDCVYETTEVSSLGHVLVSKSLSSAMSSASFNHDLYTTSCSGYNSDRYPMSVVLSKA